ncbi:baseplate J/gp47 family protein [Rufibacter ruber]|uniref:baseplate J/gp47 family protein n=1 Tax=Rufibacter ruber TaxID=1783499 RepID=UPI0013799162|nr:baseplate J/gp47 family protein [Rufibacter ruber]
MLVKVAKLVNNNLVKLTEAEVNGLKAYIAQIKTAGQKTMVSSLDADQISVNADVYYDPSFLPDTVKTNVITAITTYLKNIDFSGQIIVSRLQDAIQAVEGVKDVQIHNIRTRVSTETAANAETHTRIYDPYAGYVVPDTTNGYTLQDTIQMIVF